MEDLWAFNSEELALAVQGCSIPIVSAVGHETDFTICDFVADFRAPTPSAAAELVVPDRLDLLNTLQATRAALQSTAIRRAELARLRLVQLRNRPSMARPQWITERLRQYLDAQSRDLLTAYRRRCHVHRLRMEQNAARLDAMSPLKVLSRGYAIASHAEHVVTDVKTLHEGDELQLRFARGQAVCKVIKTME